MRRQGRNVLEVVMMVWLMVPGASRAREAPHAPPARVLHAEDFAGGNLDSWSVYGGGAHIGEINGTATLQTEEESQLFWGAANDRTRMITDVSVEGDVSPERADVSCGFLVRAGRQTNGSGLSGYFACCRKLSAGYTIVQLYRFPEYALLQEARVRGAVKAHQPLHLKVMCKGTSIWVWANHTSNPAITEFDNNCLTPGFVGLRSESSKVWFDNIVVSTGGDTPRAPCVRDWSGIKGAVFITSDSVNSYQMWEEYHPDVVDRELSYAHDSGLNTVEVYLNFLMWQKVGRIYLNRIEDFLSRAVKHGLKVTFIFFDDVGNVEPPHLAPYQAPIPGIHNSQMQGCPGRDIIDSHYAEYRTRLKSYVLAVVTPHKNDPRILFWQTYNEPSHATTLPLLADAYAWIKETGSRIPVSATGGGAFYGSYYSDFPTFHSYLDTHAPQSQNMVLGDGGSEHLCTETLDRPGVDLPKLVKYFSARKTGWIIWELMIGRDNCRFPWGSPPGAPEPSTPFHGLVYPDGHPWSIADIRNIQAK